MNKDTYRLIATYMLSCMEDSAHGEDHIYRQRGRTREGEAGSGGFVLQ